ncbi:hypothetical protein P154DRAFT_213549 [Amniculicola lignicola CBS 123094]|uniref:DUF3253 domain-containing protein n=1 Tax=Amniculicola lignicola CBS 123094 TaxID=1392246 RepID=A0A6A5WFR9_9PLEO|nr:hypothetical protein P154DRAFT_213549 [Amniculicola lignicola CBS 123094]
MRLNSTQKSIIMSHTSTLLQARQFPKTICPSEIARSFSASELRLLNAATWRDTMDDIQDVLWDMWKRGQVEVLQKGAVLGPPSELRWEDIRGPIRVRKSHDGNSEVDDG